MIHVCFCFHDKTGHYSKFVGTAMLSLFENLKAPPQPVTIHLLHDDTLTDDNREKFIQIAERYNQFVKFYNVEELCADEIKAIYNVFPNIDKTRFSIAMCYLFFIPQVLSEEIEKAIYLDADIIVNLDINELWQVELDENFLAGVSEYELGSATHRQELCIDGHVKIEDYFNSGVLLMNLKLMRNEEEILTAGIKFVGENPRYHRLFDQNILNYCFSTRKVKLPLKFDQMTYLCRKRKETDIKREIYHLAGANPTLDMNNSFSRLWMDYFIRTPFFDSDSIGRLYEGFLKTRNDLKVSAANISAIVSGKTRAFFVDPAKIDSMKKFFAIRDDEIIIPAENEESLQKLIDAMKTSKDKCVFFIMTEKFLKKKFPFNRLTKAGFVEKKDFVKGWSYLSAEYGNPFNSYPLIQNI